MKKINKNIFVALVALTGAAYADDGSAASKPEGFRFFDKHLTVKPYVSLTYAYDNNIDTAKKKEGDNLFLVTPGADFLWTGDRWSLTGSLYYRYSYYCEYSDTMDESAYGESLSYRWSNVGEDQRGWNLMIQERYEQSSQADTYGDGGGGIWRDRERVDVSGALERWITSRWHMDVTGQYSWLDYLNDSTKYAPLYGNSSWSAGLGGGYVLGPWTDMLVELGYTGYRQHGASGGTKSYSNDSESYTAQAGIGTHATEKISYRLLAGASWLDYGGHSNTDSGWTYSLSANWRLTRCVQLSALGSSYYQPSERSLGTAQKVYTMSLGASYLTLGDKLNLSANVAYRLEDTVYSDYYYSAGRDSEETIFSFRFGATYTINRWVSALANIDYQKSWDDDNGGSYDYDRLRFELGVRFHY